MSLLSFHDLPLRPELLASVEQMGFTEPTPIQSLALPLALEGMDLIGKAETGSGKTAAFGLALLQSVDTGLLRVQSLVLCPTRELAEQVASELRRLAACLDNTRILTLTGGRSSTEQARSLAEGCHVVVGTPGRVGSHLAKGRLALGSLRVLVLDEADRMLDMGFVDQVLEVVRMCPPRRQALLFSATMPDEVVDLSRTVQNEPVLVDAGGQVAPDTLRQQVVRCHPSERNQLVVDLLAAHAPDRALVFCETKVDCRRLASFLAGRGAVALALHGDLEQRERDEALLQLTNGSASVLVATDVAARGLDIPELPLVILAELSPQPENHVHRVGRTARAGESGLAVSIVAGPADEARLHRIQELLGENIEEAPAPGPGGGLAFLTPPNRTLLILAGRQDKVSKGDVLGALVKDAGVPGEAIGRIDLGRRTVAVAIAREHAQSALDFLSTGRVKNRRVRARLLG